MLRRLAGDDHNSRPSSHAALRVEVLIPLLILCEYRHAARGKLVLYKSSRLLLHPLSVQSHICGSIRPFHLHSDGSADQRARRVVHRQVCDFPSVLDLCSW